MTTYEVLSRIVDLCATVPDVKTAKLGLETGITPEDYPMIRVVPSSLSKTSSATRRTADVLIYFGAAINEFEAGLPAVYEYLLTMEEAIIARVCDGNGLAITHRGTVTDEDRLTTYKCMAARFEVVW